MQTRWEEFLEFYYYSILGPLITRLGGLDALLSQGALSAGERQLICIARAVLTNAGVSGRESWVCSVSEHISQDLMFTEINFFF